MGKFYGISPLPEGYSLKDEIDLIQDKKLLTTVNVLSLFLFLPFVLPVLNLSSRTTVGIPFWAGFLIGLILILIVHEGIHAAFFRLFGDGKVTFKFHGWAFSASMEGTFFSKAAYLWIGASPVVLLSVVIGIAALVWPTDAGKLLAWVLFAVQFSSAAGDFYVLWRFRNLPKDALIEDRGAGMKVFSRAPRP